MGRPSLSEQKEVNGLSYSSFKKTFPEQPDPKSWVDNGRDFSYTGPKCKLCASYYRGLIEDLITITGFEPLFIDADIVRWANHHNLFSAKPLSPANLWRHKHKHMNKNFPDLKNMEIDNQRAKLALRDMSVIGKLDMIADKAFEKVYAGTKTPTVTEGLRAIQIRGAIPTVMLEQEILQVQLETMRSKTIEGEVIEPSISETVEGEIEEE
ncbi:hypothetical protein [Candidatus Oleimmundimicrobium sp.]|uniref:hypothetical protein n=1 Tax=Candidatus Oleimmundimicrobium sp. TaxID=3060597 RepID=UPI0027170E99|nr:hypothetical protein [Candidatus Oleimmundimicrobium sp.]MDO8885735.1 hypothetical protein [Candidatus Oleimmundimicrobium sp.]